MIFDPEYEVELADQEEEDVIGLFCALELWCCT